jgi:hypothetical protein
MNAILDTPNRTSWIRVTAIIGLIALAVGAASASAKPVKAAKAEQMMKVMIQGGGAIDVSRSHLAPGPATLAVRNTHGGSTVFLIARHQGGFGSLPRYNGNAFVPSNEIVGPIESVSAHTQKLVTRTLKPGGYLLVTSKTKLGGDLPILAGAAVAFSVR